MDLSQYFANRVLERVPSRYFVAKGCGSSDLTVHAGSFHHALKAMGIQDYNIMSYSSILPAGCEETTERPVMQRGAVMDTILARHDGVKGDFISAGIIIGDLIKKSSKKKEGSLVCEIGDKISGEQLAKKLQLVIAELHADGYAEEYDLENLRIHSESCKVDKEHGTVLVALCFTEHEMVYAPIQTEHKEFLGLKRSFKNSKYVVQPILYDATATYKRGMKEGPAAILDASTHLELYDIETDFQPHTEIDIATMPFLELGEDPATMVEEVSKATKKILDANKVPITLTGGHGVTIGVLDAFRNYKEDFTVLQLDAHSDLRDSYDGTRYSEACVMRRALEVTDNIVQVGIRSISNRERPLLNYEKLFLAQDIKSGGDEWIDDVIEECTDNVYITFDVDVLDPSIVFTGTPEPDGLYYEHILKLFRKLTKSRKIIGIDVNGLVPVTGMNSPEFTIAKLVFQLIAFNEKFGR